MGNLSDRVMFHKNETCYTAIIYYITINPLSWERRTWEAGGTRGK